MRRRMGLEIEMTDVRILQVVDRVFAEYDDRDPATWQDRWGAHSKPEYDFSVYNVVSDSTLLSADGCRPMYKGHLDDGTVGKASGAKKAPRNWCGAELLSPAQLWGEEEWAQLDGIVTDLKGYGATFDPHQKCALHVHVEIKDFDFDQLKSLAVLGFLYQDALDSTVNGSGAKYRLRKQTKLELEKLLDSETVGEFAEIWSHDPEGERRGEYSRVTRRLVDVGPVFRSFKTAKTVEFRCFRAHHNIEFLRLAGEISERIVEEAASGHREVDPTTIEMIDELNRLGAVD